MMSQQLDFQLLDCDYAPLDGRCKCLSHNGFLTRAGYQDFDERAGLTGVDEGVTFQKERVTESTETETTMWLSDGQLDEQARRVLGLLSEAGV